MRVAIDVRSLIEPFPSGVSAYTHHIVQNLIAYYPDNEYILFSNSVTGVSKEVQQLAENPSVTIYNGRRPNKVFNTLLTVTRRPHLDTLVGAPDVFFVPNISFAAFSKKIPLVVTAHDVSFAHTSFYSPKARLWHRIINPGRIYRRADKIIAVSYSTKRDIIERYNIPQERIKVISHGVEYKMFDQVSDKEKQLVENTYGLHRSYVLFLGNVDRRKNIAGLLTAWKMVQQKNSSYDLVIAGNQEAKPIPQQAGVISLGYVPEQHKPALYASAKAFVYPSFYEGFGLPLLEAMAAGVPVITSFSTALAEVAGDAALTVDPYNTNELGRGILQVLDDESLRIRMIGRGKERARTYTWQRSAQQTSEIFKSLI